MEAYLEYVALLNLYAAEDLAELRRDDADAADWNHNPEATGAWSAAFESDDESRLEMEADDARCGGTFSELLYGDDFPALENSFGA